MSQTKTKAQPSSQGTAGDQPADATAQQTRLEVVSQAFRYCEYGAGQSLSRSIRLNRNMIQFVVNTWCDATLQDKEVEVGVEIRDFRSGEPVFETFWVTTLAYQRQQSSFIFRELPPELAELPLGNAYIYYASAQVNETGDFADRHTRVDVR